MDGPAFVSQCPIVPDHAFTYVVFLHELLRLTNDIMFLSFSLEPPGMTFLSRVSLERIGTIRIYLLSTAMGFGG